MRAVEARNYAVSPKLLRKQRFTRLRTTPASFGADTAMFFLLAVFLTRGRAAFACLDARAELRARKLEVGAGKARHDARCRQGHIGTVVAIADAIDHLSHFLFAEAGVSAGVASLGTRVARGDALDNGGVIR